MSIVEADRKVDLARAKIQDWGARVSQGTWDWHSLGHALQLVHEAIEASPTYQRPWTLLADTYHRIGKGDLARRALERSFVLATPGPRHPGRFYGEVEGHLRTGYPFNASGRLSRQEPPAWFVHRYQRYWSLDDVLLAQPKPVPPGSVPSVFLSYAREDEMVAERLRVDLSGHGIAVWKDTKDLLPGEDWARMILETLKASDFVVVCLSRTSIAKPGFFQVELDQALQWQAGRPDGAVYLVPVRLDRCEPPGALARLHVQDLFEDWHEGIEKIVRVIRR